MSKELMNFVDDIDELSESQKDRMKIQNLLQEELVGYLRNRITLVDAKTELKDLAMAEMTKRITDAANPLANSVLLSLIDILLRSDSTSEANILGILKEQQKVVVNLGDTAQPRKRESDFSEEEIQEAKKVLDLLNKARELKKSEFSIEEDK